jgi:hypothetical protein
MRKFAQTSYFHWISITLLVTYAQMQRENLITIQIASLLKDGQPVVAEVCL